MHINNIELPYKNKLMKHYREEGESILSFFDYKPFASYQSRLEELRTRTFNRDGLAEVLEEMNRGWDASEQTLDQIDKLRKEDAVVVIGGQQAGLLTGPMYTVNKIISIISLAKQQSQALQVPVVPVFWIAGEDHDFDEINHIYTKRHHTLHKHIVGQQVHLGYPLSDLEMDVKAVREWLDKSFYPLKETSFTKKLHEVISSCLEKSASYVDFCARLIHALFPSEGIVLIDSGNQALRTLESRFFEQIILKQPEISKAVYETTQLLEGKGYDVPLDVTANDGHLFYHDQNNERILLSRKGDKWIGKNGEMTLTTAQLLNIAKENPHKLSNNVVTRPLVQELLFPTLSFVAGDGEISYWASLKEMFHILQIKMPPVMPRLSLTYVPARIEKLLYKRDLTAKHVLRHDIREEKAAWLAAQQTYALDELFAEAKAQIKDIHKPLQAAAETIRADVEELAKKNVDYVIRQLTFLENKMVQGIEEKHQNSLSQFDEIALMLSPNQVLQERIWSPLPFVNEVGPGFIEEIIKRDLPFENNHYCVYL